MSGSHSTQSHTREASQRSCAAEKKRSAAAYLFGPISAGSKRRRRWRVALSLMRTSRCARHLDVLIGTQHRQGGCAGRQRWVSTRAPPPVARRCRGSRPVACASCRGRKPNRAPRAAAQRRAGRSGPGLADSPPSASAVSRPVPASPTPRGMPRGAALPLSPVSVRAHPNPGRGPRTDDTRYFLAHMLPDGRITSNYHLVITLLVITSNYYPPSGNY